MDFKSQLQISCAKRGLQLPVYNVIDSCGPPHKKQWKVGVSMMTEDGEIGAESDYFTTKKSAEKAAAFHLLNMLNSTQTKITDYTVYKAPKKFSYVALFDIENIPQAIDMDYKVEIYKIGVISRYSHHTKSIRELKSK
jgi:hypothetical protein